MTNAADGDDWRTNPGIVVFTRADWDGWPQGMPLAHVGPFANYDEYREWMKETFPPHGSPNGLHTNWERIVSPANFDRKLYG